MTRHGGAEQEEKPEMLQDLGKFVARMDLKLLQLAQVAPFDVLARERALSACSFSRVKTGQPCHTRGALRSRHTGQHLLGMNAR